MGPLTVSPMGFGTWTWGNQLLWGYQEHQQTFNLAVVNGINLFDTADSYGTRRLNREFPVFCSHPHRRISVLCTNSSRSQFRTKASMAETVTGKSREEVKVFDSEEELAVSLAKYTADLSKKFCKERDAFTVVVSGGSLIKSLRKLVEPPYIDSIDWSKWHVFWVDERVVRKDHPQQLFACL